MGRDAFSCGCLYTLPPWFCAAILYRCLPSYWCHRTYRTFYYHALQDTCGFWLYIQVTTVVALPAAPVPYRVDHRRYRLRAGVLFVTSCGFALRCLPAAVLLLPFAIHYAGSCFSRAARSAGACCHAATACWTRALPLLLAVVLLVVPAVGHCVPRFTFCCGLDLLYLCLRAIVATALRTTITALPCLTATLLPLYVPIFYGPFFCSCQAYLPGCKFFCRSVHVPPPPLFFCCRYRTVHRFFCTSFTFCSFVLSFESSWTACGRYLTRYGLACLIADPNAAPGSRTSSSRLFHAFPPRCRTCLRCHHHAEHRAPPAAAAGHRAPRTYLPIRTRCYVAPFFAIRRRRCRSCMLADLCYHVLNMPVFYCAILPSSIPFLRTFIPFGGSYCGHHYRRRAAAAPRLLVSACLLLCVCVAGPRCSPTDLSFLAFLVPLYLLPTHTVTFYHCHHAVLRALVLPTVRLAAFATTTAYLLLRSAAGCCSSLDVGDWTVLPAGTYCSLRVTFYTVPYVIPAHTCLCRIYYHGPFTGCYARTHVVFRLPLRSYALRRTALPAVAYTACHSRTTAAVTTSCVTR